MNNLRIAANRLTAALAMLLAGPALAQLPPSTSPPPKVSSDGEITVEGQRNRDQLISTFVGALTKVPFGGQVAQFSDAVCPRVVGLLPLQNAAIEARLRRVARGANIRVAPLPCITNLLVAAVPDKPGLITALHKRRPDMFADLPWFKLREIDDPRRPVAAWQVLGFTDRNGIAAGKAVPSADGPGGFYVVEGTGSRLSTALRPNFATAFVVFELKAIGGLTTTQVADYAAMRTFAETDPQRAAATGVTTILTLVEDAAADRPLPLTLTQWDFSFLKSLYATPAGFYANRKRSAMEQAFDKALKDAAKQEK